MTEMLRNILSLVVGFITGSIIFTLFQLLSHAFSPKPVGMDFNDMSMVEEFMGSMPVSSLLIVVAGYIVGTFVAGVVVGKIAASRNLIFPLMVAVLFMGGWTFNIVMFPHPIWMTVLVYLVFFPAVLAGHRIAGPSNWSEAA